MATWLGPPVERYDYGTNGGSWTRQPAIIVLHSTEGTGWTNYGNGASAPHFTIEPKSGEIHQHISMSHAARALKNPSGGVETNRGGAIQIEIVGTCDPKHRGDSGWNYLPDMNSTQIAHIRALLDMIHEAIPAIPLTTSVEFEPYPSPSYGSGYPRLSGSKWNSYKGTLGHQHTPENDHGDPGDIPIAKILGDQDSDDEENLDMIGIVKTDVPGLTAQFLYTGDALVWIENGAHLDQLNYVYRKQTGHDLIVTTIGDQAPIEDGHYGYLAPNAPDPTSAGVQAGWDFSKHRADHTTTTFAADTGEDVDDVSVADMIDDDG